MTEALDQLERQLGFTLTGPVRELVNTRIVNVLSKSLGVVARDDKNQDVVVYLLPRNSEVPLEQSTDFGTDAANQAGVDIRVMAGERDSPDARRLQGRRHRDPEPPRQPPGPQPDPRQVRHQPRRPPLRHRHRPDRRRLDRRRVRDRGRHERRGSRRAVDGAAAVERFLICVPVGGRSCRRFPKDCSMRSSTGSTVEFDPEQIILFGSHAWGTPSEDSDIDLLVIVPDSDARPTQRASDVPTAVCAVS